jgi:hypothetical protein
LPAKAIVEVCLLKRPGDAAGNKLLKSKASNADTEAENPVERLRITSYAKRLHMLAFYTMELTLLSF